MLDNGVIIVENYHKQYNETVAVQGLSFSVASGQIMGLVGPNGAGKTTTLRAICGIIAPSKGTLSVAGYNLADDSVAAKQELAYVPDDPKLFDALTVWEHLTFIASAYRVDAFEEKAEVLIEQFELTEKRNTIAQELSRGMKQKVAICCAYLHQPKAILFDEPLTGLDPRAIRTLRQSIVERATAGSAVIISSHLLSLVEDLCTHLLILNKGKSLFCGTVDEAHQAFASEGSTATLEELFFLATENHDAESESTLEPTQGGS